MKSILIPHKYKKLGWYLLLPSFLGGIILLLSNFESPIDWKINVFAIFYDGFFTPKKYFGITEVNVISNLTAILFLVGGLLVVFSKEKIEDELIHNIRLNALQWAVFTNYLFLLLAVLFIYGTPFFTVMVCNMFTIIIIYIPRFYFLLWKLSKTT
jgi:hypothetical protein